MTEEKQTQSRLPMRAVFAVISRLIEVGLLALLVVVAIATFFPGKSFTGPYRLFTVMSGSMEPAISTGSLIISKGIESADKDQIVVYEDPRSDIPNSFVAHRIIEVNEVGGVTEYTTKGDANENADRYIITNNDLIGNVEYFIPQLGYLAAYAKTAQGLVLLAILPGLLIIVMELRRLVKTFDSHYKSKYEKEKEADKKKEVLTSSLLIFFALGFSIFASSSGIAAMFTGQVNGVNNTFASTEWLPEAPIGLGWNFESQSASYNEQPLDLDCPAGDDTYYTNENALTFNWTEVESPLPQFDVRYVRENTRPNGFPPIQVPGSGSYLQNYTTPWGSFGAGSGEYLTKVKAFVDVNANGQLDGPDFESDWSNSCSITYDPDAPEFPGQPGWATETPASGYQGDGDLTDFVPCGGAITQTGVNYFGVWGEATDALAGFDHYQRQVVYNGSLVHTDTNNPNNYAGPFQAQDGVSPNGGNGQYYVRVRAIDNLGNATISDTEWADTSNFASWCGLTIDTVAPTSSITVTSSPTRQIEERIINGDFEAGLADWQTLGDVEIVDGPIDGRAGKMVLIGNESDVPTDDGQSIDVNILSQEIPHTSGGDDGIRSIGFWYNFHTYEPTDGFDEPGFMVFVGDKMVHQVWASDIADDPDDDSLDKTGWKFLSLNFSQIDDPTLTLAFYSGNTGDLSHQSFVYIDDVTSNEAVVNSQAEFALESFDSDVATVHYAYHIIGEEPMIVSGAPGTTFSITGQPDGDVIEYWSVDAAGNEEEHNTFHVLFDDMAPEPIDDLVVTDQTGGDFLLDFPAPSDDNPFGVDQAADYDIRYSTDPIATDISGAAWELLSKPAIINTDGLPGGGTRAPLQSGNDESYLVHVSEGPATYYFAIKAGDRAGNWANLIEGSVATTGVETPVAAAVSPGDVVINELMWMGSTTSISDEWIELRNMTSEPISLAGWRIENAGTAGSPNIVLPIGAEIPANGFYLISNYDQVGSSIKIEPDFVTTGLDLINGGEQLSLVDTIETVIDQTPAIAPAPSDSWPAGENSPNQSMERNNIPADGTVATNWHTCDSDSCAEARNIYWDDASQDNYGTPKGDNLSFDESQIETTANLSWADEENLILTLQGIQMFTSADYVISYNHLVDDQTINDALTGNLDFPENTRQLSSDELFLGTCSAGQEPDQASCVPHLQIENIILEVTLRGDNVPDRVVTATLETE